MVRPGVIAAPFDPAVGAAFAAMGPTPKVPSYLDPALDVSVEQDSEVARRQDALGAMLWRSLDPGIEPRSQILMPPLMWNVTPTDAQAVLSAVGKSGHLRLGGTGCGKDILDFTGGYRRREQKALEGVAAHLGEDSLLLLGLHALGGDLDVKGMGEGHHGLHDGHGHTSVFKLTDK